MTASPHKNCVFRGSLFVSRKTAYFPKNEVFSVREVDFAKQKTEGEICVNALVYLQSSKKRSSPKGLSHPLGIPLVTFFLYNKKVTKKEPCFLRSSCGKHDLYGARWHNAFIQQIYVCLFRNCVRIYCTNFLLISKNVLGYKWQPI